jgi:hypothetical protein
MAKSKAKVKFDIPLAQSVTMKAVRRGVRAATLEAQRIVQVDILSSTPQRTGRKYKRGKNNYHIASAPGEAPAPDTGQLRNMTTVSFSTDNENPMVAVGKVVNNLEKGADLELGTDRIAPRPWISLLLSGEYKDRIFATFARFSRL